MATPPIKVKPAGGGKKHKGKGGGSSEAKKDQKTINQEAKFDEALGNKYVDKFLPDISVLGGLLDTNRPGDTQASLDKLQSLINLQEGGLGGLTGQELQARREEGQQEVDRNYQTQLRAMAAQAARSGVRGAASQANFQNLAHERLGAQQGLERDLLIANADVQDRRRQMMAQALNAQFGQLEQDRQSQFLRQQFNAQQQGKFVAGQQGLFFGGQGLNMARRDALRNYRIGQAGVEAAKQGAASQMSAFNSLFGGANGPGSSFTSNISYDANGVPYIPGANPNLIPK